MAQEWWITIVSLPIYTLKVALSQFCTILWMWWKGTQHIDTHKEMSTQKAHTLMEMIREVLSQIVRIVSLRPVKTRHGQRCGQLANWRSLREATPPQLNPIEEGPPKKTTNPKTLCLKRCSGHANEMEMSSFWEKEKDGRPLRYIYIREKEMTSLVPDMKLWRTGCYAQGNQSQRLDVV